MIIYVDYQGVYREIHTENENAETLQRHIIHCQYELANIDKEIDTINRLIRTCRNPYLAGELFSDRLRECQVRRERFSESICLLCFATGFKHPIELDSTAEMPEIFERITTIKNFLEAAEKHISKKMIKAIVEDAYKIGLEKLQMENNETQI